MQKFITFIVILILCLWGTCTIVKNKAVKKARLENDKVALLKNQQIKQSINQMVSKHGANTNWKSHLSDGDSIRGKFLTVDLEHLWITEYPILFIGRLEDISTHDSEYYVIQIEPTFIDSIAMLDTCLNLELRAHKTIVDDLLNNHRGIMGKDLSNFVNNNIAVIAQIESVKCSQKIQSDENGFSTIDVKTGVGNCIDILYVGTFDGTTSLK